jgi:hypothetical protein
MALVTVSGGDTVDAVVSDVPNMNPPAEASASLDDIRLVVDVFAEQAQSPDLLDEDRAKLRADGQQLLAEYGPHWAALDAILRDPDLTPAAKERKASAVAETLETIAEAYASSVNAEEQRLAEMTANAPKLRPSPDGKGFTLASAPTTDVPVPVAVELRTLLRGLEPNELTATLVKAAREGNVELLAAARSANPAFRIGSEDAWNRVAEVELQNAPNYGFIKSARLAQTGRDAILRAARSVAARFKVSR